MRPGKIKQQLANKLRDLFGDAYSINVDSLTTNRGANRFNDGVSWEGYMIDHLGMRFQVHSWDTMTDLVRAKKIVIVGGKIDRLCNEISVSE